MRYPGFLRTFGSRLGAGLADELLDRWFPPPPSFLQRFAEAFVDQAPVIVSMVQYYYLYTKGVEPKRDPAVVGVGVVGWEPVCAPLGEFTCPKCGGHTWSTLGGAPCATEAPDRAMLERYCTNGLETSYGPGKDPNTVKKPCMFRWFSTDDHLYFAKPSAEGARRATETQACVPPESSLPHWPVPGSRRWASDAAREWPKPILGTTPETAEICYASLLAAVGNRFAHGAESLGDAAARLITEADAFIKKQSDKIADLMLDNVFPAGRGEIGFVLTHDVAKKIGVRYEEGAEPIRATLVLDGWRWMIRLGPGRVGGQLVPVEWVEAENILRNAAGASVPDQTAMAQNAAGGVA